jgi:hypothetical protein
VPTIAATTPRSQAFPDPIPDVLLFGSANLFAGAQRVGKTTILAQWITAWQTGAPICGFPTNAPTEICYLAADRPFEFHQLLLAKAGCAPLRHYCLIDDLTVTIDQLAGRQATGAQLLEIALKMLNPKPGALLIIDPLAPFYILGSALESRAVAATMAHLARLAKARQLTILGLMHFVKQKGGKQENYSRPMDRMSGSGSFAGFSLTQMWLLPPDLENNQPYFTVGWNPPNGAEQEFFFTRDAWGLFQPINENAITPGTAIAPDPPRLADLLMSVTNAGETGCETKELRKSFCEQYEISRALFFQDLQLLHSRGEIDHIRRGWVRRRKVQ